MYSFRMSFCTVPASRARFAPCCLATATYSASRMAAVELMVIEVETRSSGMPSKSVCMSSSESMATPTLPTSPCASAMIGVHADLRGQIERDGKPGLALFEQIAIAAIRFGGAAEAGILPHGPEAAAIHGGIDAARERKLSGVVQVALRVPAVQVVGRDNRFHRQPGGGRRFFLGGRASVCRLVSGMTRHRKRKANPNSPDAAARGEMRQRQSRHHQRRRARPDPRAKTPADACHCPPRQQQTISGKNVRKVRPWPRETPAGSRARSRAASPSRNAKQRAGYCRTTYANSIADRGPRGSFVLRQPG